MDGISQDEDLPTKSQLDNFAGIAGPSEQMVDAFQSLGKLTSPGQTAAKLQDLENEVNFRFSKFPQKLTVTAEVSLESLLQQYDKRME